MKHLPTGRLICAFGADGGVPLYTDHPWIDIKIQEAFCRRLAEGITVDQPKRGIWVWEGSPTSTPALAMGNDEPWLSFDVGAWRKPTPEEIAISVGGLREDPDPAWQLPPWREPDRCAVCGAAGPNLGSVHDGPITCSGACAEKARLGWNECPYRETCEPQ